MIGAGNACSAFYVRRMIAAGCWLLAAGCWLLAGVLGFRATGGDDREPYNREPCVNTWLVTRYDKR